MNTALLKRPAGREIEIPVDSLGRQRMLVTLDHRSVERRGDDKEIGFKGHAAVFGSPTWIGPARWGFMERVAAGAFSKTISEADVRFLINHDPNLVLARNTAGTLRLSEDDEGLLTDADMAPTSYAKDLAISLERGDITQMSFAFEVVKDEWEVVTNEDDGPDYELRTLLELKLWDVSAVTYPAYDDTDAALRAAGFDALSAAIGLDGTKAAEFLRTMNPDLTSPRAAGKHSQHGDDSETEPPASTRSHSQPPASTGDNQTDIDEFEADRQRRIRALTLSTRKGQS